VRNALVFLQENNMTDRQIEYKATVFTVTYDKKSKGYKTDGPKPPAGGGWRLVNCYEAPAVDNWSKALTAVWERE
jgi:hypothetical protein